MIHIHVTRYLWPDIVLYTYHLINRMSSSILYDKTSFSYFYPNTLMFPHIPRVFGCTWFIQDSSFGLDKLSPCTIKYVFI